jgi:RecB family exonuclease
MTERDTVTQPQIYLEPYGELAQQRLVDLIARAKAGDPLAPVTVVVPTPYAGLSLRRSLAKARGLVNVRFMVPARLAEYLGSPAMAGLDKAPLFPLIEMATIRATAQEMTDGPLTNVADHPRLHLSLQSTFRDMAYLAEADLRHLKEDSDPLRRQLALWYEAYRRRIAGYYSREDVVRAAVTAIEADAAGPALRDLGTVVFFLIGDLSLTEIALVSALGRLEKGFAIFGLTGDAEVDEVIQKQAIKLEQNIGNRYFSSDGFANREVEHLVSACDSNEEIRWVIRDIFRRAGEGLTFHQIAVLYRRSDPYGFLIPGQMALAGLPVAGPDPTPLRDTPAGRSLIALLEINQTGYSRDTVMRWLAEAPVRITDNPEFSEKDLAQWEILSSRAGIVKGINNWIRQLSQHRQFLAKELKDLEEVGEVDPARVAGLASLLASADSLISFIQRLAQDLIPPSTSSWADYAGWATKLLGEYCQDPGLWPQEHRPSYQRLGRLLEEIGSLSEELLPADLPGFRALLETGMERPSGRTGPTGSGVFVGSLAAAQGMHFEVVYIVGVNEGTFPPALADDPLLPDQVRENLNFGERLPLRRTRRIEERRIYLAALAAGRKRILLYPQADNTAMRALYPAPWFLDEARRLRGAPVASADLTRLSNQPWLSIIQSIEDSSSYVAKLGPADIHDYDVASVSRWRKLRRPLGERFLVTLNSPLARATQAEVHRLSHGFSQWDGRLSEIAGTSHRLRLPEDRPISPTRLERWAICPFRYFLGDVLGLAALERPEELWTISPLDRGSLVHRILEQFMKEIVNQKFLPDTGRPWDPSHQSRLLEIAEELFREAEAAGITGRPLLWAAAKEEIRQDLIGFLEKDSQWRVDQQAQPVWIEQRFGFSGGLPAPEITLLNGHQLRFRGLIDRVDRTKDGKAFVFDYKTGSSYPYGDIKPSDPTGQGKHLQLPVYALAVLAGMDTVTDIKMFYWFVTRRNEFEKKAMELDQAQKPFRQAVEAIVDGIRQGIFPAIPGPRSRGSFENCMFCDFDRICPANRDILWERKGQDPQVVALRSRLGSAEGSPSEGEGQ